MKWILTQQKKTFNLCVKEDEQIALKQCWDKKQTKNCSRLKNGWENIFVFNFYHNLLCLRQYEEAIAKYEGSDPLSPWYEFICWIEQSFPQSGNESGLDEAVIKCIVAFENDQRYNQDRRMIKLYIKYVSK